MLSEGFACIPGKWFWPTKMSLFLSYGSPEASCIKWAESETNNNDEYCPL